MALRAETLGVHGTDAAIAMGDSAHNAATWQGSRTRTQRGSTAPARFHLIHSTLKLFVIQTAELSCSRMTSWASRREVQIFRAARILAPALAVLLLSPRMNLFHLLRAPWSC